jgi:hypothetical protein
MFTANHNKTQAYLKDFPEGGMPDKPNEQPTVDIRAPDKDDDISKHLEDVRVETLEKAVEKYLVGSDNNATLVKQIIENLKATKVPPTLPLLKKNMAKQINIIAKTLKGDNESNTGRLPILKDIIANLETDMIRALNNPEDNSTSLHSLFIP